MVILGRSGDEEITADDIAGWAGTISYDVLAGIGPRVARVYLDGDKVAAVRRGMSLDVARDG